MESTAKYFSDKKSSKLQDTISLSKTPFTQGKEDGFTKSNTKFLEDFLDIHSQENQSPQTYFNNFTICESESSKRGKTKGEVFSDRFIPIRNGSDEIVEQSFLLDDMKAHSDKFQVSQSWETDESKKDDIERQRKYLDTLVQSIYGEQLNFESYNLST